MTAAKLREVPRQEEAAPLTGLALLRAPFPPNAISKKPKPTKAQNDAVKADFKKGVRCKECGGWHHPEVVHLDYVGHAALTDRLLDVDPRWTWEPVADPESLGLPTAPGGMWIRLTVDGVTRLGFGHPDGKSGGDAIKETIGDALRNAAMRFGAALDLWHKGVLHADEAPADAPDNAPPPVSAMEKAAAQLLTSQTEPDAFKAVWEKNKDGWKAGLDRDAYGRIVAIMRTCAEQLKAKAAPPPAENLGIGDDEIPY